jgi:hypothetical protein
MKVLQRSNLLTIEDHGPFALLVPTEEGIAEAKEECSLEDMLESFLCNGWSMIPPEVIGALTDAPIISQDFYMNDDGIYESKLSNPVVFAHMNYCIEDPVKTWARGKPVLFEKA